MGSRLSMPKGVAGTTEISNPRTSPFPRNCSLNSRQLVAPVAAFTMACLLFVYARTSIRAAKTNAQRHREADSGGEGLNLLAESRRRHGMGEKLDEGGTVKQLVKGAKEQWAGQGSAGDADGKAEGSGDAGSAGDRLKAAMGRKRD